MTDERDDLISRQKAALEWREWNPYEWTADNWRLHATSIEGVDPRTGKGWTISPLTEELADVPTLDAAKSLAQKLQAVLDGTSESREAE